MSFIMSRKIIEDTVAIYLSYHLKKIVFMQFISVENVKMRLKTRPLAVVHSQHLENPECRSLALGRGA